MDITDEDNVDSENAIAIVGMAGRFPGATDITQFWNNLLARKVELTHFSTSELLEAGVNPVHLQSGSFVKAAPVLAEPDRFDAEFFNYSPYEAELIDPQQRQLLEVAWLAIENAGYDPSQLEGRVATFAGTAMNTYLLHTGLANHFFQDYLPTLLGSDKDYTATRIAYKLGLKGPAVTVQTACSTSLVAIHMARQSLLEQESDVALVGAASVRCPLKTGHLHQQGSVFSPDGYCRPFDAEAGGTVFGSGVGAVLLKRLEDALVDRNHIYATIKGTAINNDGNTKSDFTAPTVIKQAEVIVEAMDSAEVSANSIGYVECHGTGTFLGDPIEIEALSTAYRLDTEQSGYCRVGSVKGNIGHLDAAAGIASLIKVAKSLENKTIPASGNYGTPNPQIEFSDSPFFVAADTSAWVQPAGHPRRAGVSALGMGGTNSHVVMEEYVAATESEPLEQSAQIVPLSAASESALNRMIVGLEEHIGSNNQLSLSDVVFTLQRGRKELPYRAAVVAETMGEMCSGLKVARPPQLIKDRVQTGSYKYPVTLMFPGQGSQYAGMGSVLYSRESVFCDWVNAAEKLASEEFDLSIIDIICNFSRTDVDQTYLTQPALYVTSYAYAKLLESWGIKPQRYIGHSIGEFVAAACAGVFSFEDGLRLVINRGRLMQNAPQGSMLMVMRSSKYISDNLAANVELAVVNNTSTCVVAGPKEAVLSAKETYEKQNINCSILKTSHAFHTVMMEDAAQEFVAVAAQIKFSKPETPFISCVSGDWISDEDAVSPEYWSMQIRSSVNFSKGLIACFSQGAGWYLEAGPGTVLSQLTATHEERQENHLVLGAGKHPKSDCSEYNVARRMLAGMWALGGRVEWCLVGPESGKRVPLPGYPFEGRQYWYTDNESVDAMQVKNSGTTPADSSDWVWRESWAYLPTPPSWQPSLDNVVIFDAGAKVGSLRKSIIDCGAKADYFTNEQDFQDSLRNLNESENLGIVYIPSHQDCSVSDNPNSIFKTDFELLKRITGAFAGNVSLTVVLFNSLSVLGDKSCELDGGMVIGMLPVFEAEFPNVNSQYIDIADTTEFVDDLSRRIVQPGINNVLSFKDGRWWSRIYERQFFPQSNEDALKANAVHVIVGAFGGIGRQLTSLLARSAGKLILVGRAGPGRQSYVDSLQSDNLEVVFLNIDVTDTEGCELISTAISKSTQHAPGFVFHLAGNTADELILSKNVSSAVPVLSPKVQGTLNLHHALSDTGMTLVLFSSTAAICGPVGQVDYAAANAFQLNFANSRTRTISIAWPGWKNTGLLSKVSDVAALEQIEKSALSPEMGLAVLEQILGLDLIDGSVVVSAIDPNELIRPTSFAKTNELVEGDEAVLTDPAEIITDTLKQALKADRIEPDDNLINLGGSSLMVVTVLSTIRAKYGVAISLDEAIATPNIAAWQRLYTEALVNKYQDNKVETAGGEAEVFGLLPKVTGISRFMDRREGADFNQWNLAVMLECSHQFDKAIMETCLLELVNHHDMLRGRISTSGPGDYELSVREPLTSMTIDTVDMTLVDDDQLRELIEKTADECHQSFLLSETILFRCVHFDCGPDRPDRLLFYVHHFVADGLSWTIILSDMQTFYRQLLDGKELAKPEKTTSYRDWATQSQRRTTTDVFKDSISYWYDLPWYNFSPIPLQLGTRQDNLNTSGKHVEHMLDRKISTSVVDSNSLGSVSELLLLGLARALANWAGWVNGEFALIDVLGHGRSLDEGCDVTRTVGFFNSYSPIFIDPVLGASSGMELSFACQGIKTMLEKFNEHDLARYVCADESVAQPMSAIPQSEILFNFIGNLKNSNDDLLNPDLFKVAKESYGTIHSSASKRDHILAFRVEQIDESLLLTLVYSDNIHEKAAMNELLAHYVSELEKLSEIEENTSDL